MPKPNIAVLGYALFVTINATSLWGGVFPFFPMEFHTPEVTILFFLSQALAYCATFFLTMWWRIAGLSSCTKRWCLSPWRWPLPAR